MKGKGYRSSVCQGNLDRDRASGGSCSSRSVQHMFVMIYQTGIRLDDRGKSYIQNQRHLRNSVCNSRGIGYSGQSGSAGGYKLSEKCWFIGSD